MADPATRDARAERWKRSAKSFSPPIWRFCFGPASLDLFQHGSSRTGANQLETKLKRRVGGQPRIPGESAKSSDVEGPAHHHKVNLHSRRGAVRVHKSTTSSSAVPSDLSGTDSRRREIDEPSAANPPGCDFAAL
jgi:hypothetical protein